MTAGTGGYDASAWSCEGGDQDGALSLSTSRARTPSRKSGWRLTTARVRASSISRHSSKVAVAPRRSSSSETERLVGDMRRRVASCPAAFAAARRAVRLARRAGRLTQQMLSFAQRQHLDARPVDVVALTSLFQTILVELLGQAGTQVCR